MVIMIYSGSQIPRWRCHRPRVRRSEFYYYFYCFDRSFSLDSVSICSSHHFSVHWRRISWPVQWHVMPLLLMQSTDDEYTSWWQASQQLIWLYAKYKITVLQRNQNDNNYLTFLCKLQLLFSLGSVSWHSSSSSLSSSLSSSCVVCCLLAWRQINVINLFIYRFKINIHGSERT